MVLAARTLRMNCFTVLVNASLDRLHGSELTGAHGGPIPSGPLDAGLASVQYTISIVCQTEQERTIL